MRDIVLDGNTYPVRRALKALGARWSWKRKAWLIDESKAKEAQKLVDEGLYQWGCRTDGNCVTNCGGYACPGVGLGSSK